LTESGRIYLGQVETILQQITAANDSVAELQTAARGTLRVHVRNLVGRQVIVPALSDFLTQYPETRVELLMSNDVVDLVERNIDVDIRIGKLEDSALTFRRLVTSERIVCAAPAYLDRAPLITTPADLRQQNCLVYQVGLSRPVWRFIDPNRDVVEVAVEGTLCSDNGPSLLDAMRAGLGIGLMPDWAIRDDLATGRLLRLLPRYRVGYTEFENGVYAVYQRSRHTPTKVRVFIRFLEGLFRT
jgi:DNA-binding transcriptional LysR family regulator